MGTFTSPTFFFLSMVFLLFWLQNQKLLFSWFIVLRRKKIYRPRKGHWATVKVKVLALGSAANIIVLIKRNQSFASYSSISILFFFSFNFFLFFFFWPWCFRMYFRQKLSWSQSCLITKKALHYVRSQQSQIFKPHRGQEWLRGSDNEEGTSTTDPLPGERTQHCTQGWLQVREKSCKEQSATTIISQAPSDTKITPTNSLHGSVAWHCETFSSGFMCHAHGLYVQGVEQKVFGCLWLCLSIL